MPLKGHDGPPATEPHVFWFGNSSTLVDRILALIDRYRDKGGIVLAADVADDLEAMVNVDWNPSRARPQLGDPPNSHPGRGVGTEPGS